MDNPLGDSPVEQTNPLGDTEVSGGGAMAQGNPLGDNPVGAVEISTLRGMAKLPPGMTEQDAAWFLKDQDLAGSYSQRILSPALEGAIAPAVKIPEIKGEVVVPGHQYQADIGVALYNGLKAIPEALTAPIGSVLIPLGLARSVSPIATALGKAVETYFAGDMAKAGGAEAADAVSVLNDPNATNQQKLSSVTKAATTLGMGAAIGTHVANGLTDQPVKLDVTGPDGPIQVETTAAQAAQRVSDHVAAVTKDGETQLDSIYKQAGVERPKEAPPVKDISKNPLGDPEVSTEASQLSEVDKNFRDKLNAELVAAVKKDGWASLAESEVQHLAPNQREVYDEWVKAGKPEGGGKESVPAPVDPNAEPFVQATADALKPAEPEVQFTIQQPTPLPDGRVAKPFVQIDTKTNQGRGEPLTDAQRSVYPTAEEALASGLPTGQYTLEQVKAAIEKNKASEPAPADMAAVKSINDFGSPESDTYGIANRVNEARSASGDIAPVEPGTGMNAEDLTQRGRDLLKAGANPEEVFARFEQNKQLSSDDIALVRAQGEQLAKAANDAAEKFGTESPEYRIAAAADSSWVKRVQPLKGGISESMRAMQGETEIDTGTFHGIRRAFQQDAGRDFTPKEAVTAKKISQGVKVVREQADAAVKTWQEAVAKEVPEAAQKVSSKLLANLKERSDAALARQRAKLGRASSGLDPTDFKDYAEIGAYHIARGITDFAKWSAEMVKDLGDAIKPHLNAIFDSANKVHSDAKNGELGNTVAGIYKRVKDYIDQGETDPNDIIHKVAADTGLMVDEVRAKLAEKKSVRVVTDEMYAKLKARSDVVNSSKQWVKDQATPGYIRAIKGPFNAGFRIATFGHGTVANFTHAPLLGFNPSTFKMFWTRWAESFRLMGMTDKGAYHERVMADLVRDPNYITARRAGLANDPHKAASDYEKAWLGGWFEKVGQIGNRGFDSLKLIRQDFFNQRWDKLADTEKTPLMAQMIADSVNHATGTVKANYGPVTRGIFFAPKLIASQFALLVSDSAKAANAIAQGSKSTPEARSAAISHVKFLASVVGTYAAALAANQGLLAAAGSKQKINISDPHQADWLKFKAINLNIAPVSGPLAMVRLLGNLIRIEFGQLEGKEKRGTKGSAFKDVALDFTRSKLSPTAGVATDVVTGTDFADRPLPFSNSKVPSYMKKEGIGKYTYAEYAATHLSPIPVSEAAREVFTKQGMDDKTADHLLKAILMGVEAGAVGARVTPDYKVKE